MGRSFLSEPPCTTFSPAAHPAVRSYSKSAGFDMTCEKPCGKEQHRLSKMAWLRAWAALIELGFRESVVASCQFGSPHKSENVLRFGAVFAQFPQGLPATRLWINGRLFSGIFEHGCIRPMGWCCKSCYRRSRRMQKRCHMGWFCAGKGCTFLESHMVSLPKPSTALQQRGQYYGSSLCQHGT